MVVTENDLADTIAAESDAYHRFERKDGTLTLYAMSPKGLHWYTVDVWDVVTVDEYSFIR